MNMDMNTVRELTNAELDAVGGGGGISIPGLGNTVGSAVKGIEKLGNEVENNLTEVLNGLA